MWGQLSPTLALPLAKCSDLATPFHTFQWSKSTLCFVGFEARGARAQKGRQRGTGTCITGLMAAWSTRLPQCPAVNPSIKTPDCRSHRLPLKQVGAARLGACRQLCSVGQSAEQLSASMQCHRGESCSSQTRPSYEWMFQEEAKQRQLPQLQLHELQAHLKGAGSAGAHVEAEVCGVCGGGRAGPAAAYSPWQEAGWVGRCWGANNAEGQGGQGQ